MLRRVMEALQGRRLLLTSLLAVVVWVLAAGTMQTRFWDQLEARLFDQLTVATAPGKSNLPITIIGIDEASFAQINKRWPWPRSMHAQLVDRLHAGGAAVIAFDMIFSEASEPAESTRCPRCVRPAPCRALRRSRSMPMPWCAGCPTAKTSIGGASSRP